MRSFPIFGSLYDFSLDDQFLILSAWRAAKIAKLFIRPARFPSGAAAETANGKVFTGHKHEHPCPTEPALSHEAMEAVASKLHAGEERVVRAAFVGEGSSLPKLPGSCADLLWRASGENPNLPVYFADGSLRNICAVELQAVYPATLPKQSQNAGGVT